MRMRAVAVSRGMAVGLTILVAVMLTAPAGAGEEKTVNALASWQGRGWFFRVAEDQAYFVGAFGGVLFVEDQQGALNAARIACPCTIELGLRDAKQSGSGRCLVTAPSGDQAFGRFQCTGVHGEGCTGRFELTGGTGKLKGITGQGEMSIRASAAELSNPKMYESIQETAAGVAIWRALKYRIP